MQLPDICVKVRFDSYAAAAAFLRATESPIPQLPIVTQTSPPAAPKRENEKRGLHTKQYHAAAKEYRAANPGISYREAYRIVTSKEI